MVLPPENMRDLYLEVKGVVVLERAHLDDVDTWPKGVLRVQPWVMETSTRS
jgi:hypothetical protein